MQECRIPCGGPADSQRLLIPSRVPWKSSIAGDSGVNFQRPLVNATRKAEDIFDALATEPDNSIEAANAVVAIDNKRLGIGEAFKSIEVGGNSVHRNKKRRFKPGGGVFPIFAAIDEDKRFPGVELGGENRRGNLVRHL